MAVIPVANQIVPSGKQNPFTQPYNFGQMIGQISSWNPNFPSSDIEIAINHAIREICDRRLWYGMMTKGQIVTVPLYNASTCSVATNSATVTGVTGPSGTNWTSSLIGRSFRIGYTFPIYNIIGVDTVAQALTLELPWGGPSLSSTSYFIVRQYYSIPNIKYIYAALNLQMMYRMWTNLTQNSLDNLDPSRQRLIYPWAIAGMPPDADGNYQIELYPAAITQQALPYIAFVQPPLLTDDPDILPPYIRPDIVVKRGIADALRYRPKANPYYSEALAMQVATQKLKEYESELLHMEWADENLFRQDVIAPFERYPYFQPGGAILAAISPMIAGDAGYMLGGAGWGED